MRKPKVHVDRRDYGNTHGTHTPRRVILHDTECGDRDGSSDISGVLKYLERTPDELGVHLCVDKEGMSGQGARFNEICYHAANANTGSIGIEMIGFARFSLRVWLARRRQLRTVATWLAYLSIRYDIPLVHNTEHGVAMHKDFPAGGHTDAGANFPIRRVLKQARKIRAAHL